MSTNSVNSASSLLRLSGLSGSGIDTDSVVKKLMTAEKIPLNKLYQKRQLAEWKQDAYREVISKLKTFKDTYFNIAKSTSNMTSKSSFKQMTGTSSNSDYVTISGNADASAGSHTVSVVSIATAGKAVSNGSTEVGVTDDLTGAAISDFNLSGKTFKITLDGVTKEISLGDYSSNPSDMGNQIKTLLNNAFGDGKISVSYASSKLSFDTTGGAGRITLSAGTYSDGLASLGFASGASNRLDTSKTLGDISSNFANNLTFNSAGNLVFTINSKQFTFSSSTTLSNMMNTINADTTANVTMRYDETTDKFVITSNNTGDGENIVIGTSQEGNFFGGASGINMGDATTDPGKDASAYIDGVLVKRSSNKITLDSTTYTLLKANSNPGTGVGNDSETCTLSVNTDAVYKNISAFVDAYNDLISSVNTKLGEKYDRDYAPLTSDQKETMSDDEIKTWETKAKNGLLQNDSMLQNIVYSMRTALSDNVRGISGNLSKIGITTGDYTSNGKLTIDEGKLKAAINSNPDAVCDLFTQKAENSYAACTTSAMRSERYKTEGFANRLLDVLDDNIRTTNGKGVLLQKAGMEGDVTQYTSVIYKQIDDYDDEIDALTDKLNDKETAYYTKFSALEQYISRMSAQSSWLSSQLSS